MMGGGCRRQSASMGGDGGRPGSVGSSVWGVAGQPRRFEKGAGQCGAGIPACPRSPAQTGMSAPHWGTIRRWPSILSPPVDTHRYPSAVPVVPVVPVVSMTRTRTRTRTIGLALCTSAAPSFAFDKVWRQGVSAKRTLNPTLNPTLKRHA